MSKDLVDFDEINLQLFVGLRWQEVFQVGHQWLVIQPTCSFFQVWITAMQGQRKYPPIIMMSFFLAVALVSLNPWVCCVFSVVLRNFSLHTLCLDLAQHKTWIRGCEDGVEDRQGGTKTVFSSPHRMSPTLSLTLPPLLLLCRLGSKRWSTYKGISYWTDVAVLLLLIIFSLKLWPWLFHFFRKGKCKSLIINIRNGSHPALLMYTCYNTLL